MDQNLYIQQMMGTNMLISQMNQFQCLEYLKLMNMEKDRQLSVPYSGIPMMVPYCSPLPGIYPMTHPFLMVPNFQAEECYIRPDPVDAQSSSSASALKQIAEMAPPPVTTRNIQIKDIIASIDSNKKWENIFDGVSLSNPAHSNNLSFPVVKNQKVPKQQDKQDFSSPLQKLALMTPQLEKTHKISTPVTLSLPISVPKNRPGRPRKKKVTVTSSTSKFNFLDATGLEEQFPNYLIISPLIVKRKIARFMVNNDISRAQVGQMTDTHHHYITRFLSGEYHKVPADCRRNFIVWYLNCQRHPKKLKEFLESSEKFFKWHHIFTKEQEEVMEREYLKLRGGSLRMHAKNISRRVNEEVPESTRSIKLSSKYVLLWLQHRRDDSRTN